MVVIELILHVFARLPIDEVKGIAVVAGQDVAVTVGHFELVVQTVSLEQIAESSF